MLRKIAELLPNSARLAVACRQRLFQRGGVNACAAAGIEPVITMGREAHGPSSLNVCRGPAAPENPTPIEAMRHKLQTKEGKNATPRRADARPGVGSSSR